MLSGARKKVAPKELKHLKGNTWVITGDPMIPVYFLSEKEVVLLDTGYEFNRTDILRLTEEAGIHVRAVIGSHSHIDHNGSHAYLKENFGTELIMNNAEAALVSNYMMMTAVYAPATESDVERELPYMLSKVDRTFTSDDTEVEVDGVKFGLVFLPGHTAGHTGIITPDDVFYLGDAIIDRATLEVAKMPTSLSWKDDFETKKLLRKEKHAAYVMAHGGIIEDFNEYLDLIDANDEDHYKRLDEMYGYISERENWSEDELTEFLWEKLNMHTKRFIVRIIFKRNAMCIVEQLRLDGRVDRYFENGIFRYRAV